MIATPAGGDPAPGALNAQNSRPPYLSLWSRLAGFAHDQLTDLVSQRQVVLTRPRLGDLLAAGDHRTGWSCSICRRRPARPRAPVRLLPEFDNLVLGYADRNRIMSDTRRARVCVGSATAATALVNGTVAGMWTLTTDGQRLLFTVESLGEISSKERAAVEQQALSLMAFVDSSENPDVTWRSMR